MKIERIWGSISILLLATSLLAANDDLDIRILKVEFKQEEPDNSLTTGRGTFNSDTKNYKLDPKGSRESNAFWQSHVNFADDYFYNASNGRVRMNTRFYGIYKLDSSIISYNRTSRKKGEKMEEFDSIRAVDYARFVNDVLKLAKEDPAKPLEPSTIGKRVIFIAHAGHSRLVDGGTLGIKGANTPGDFMDAYIDSTWCDSIQCFWKGFEASAGDSIKSVIVSSESASQDGLNWGINGIIVSQIGRELGLPYSYDVVKGFSRLGYFDGMDFAGSNAGNGFFPSLPSAWMRLYKGWENEKVVKPGEKISIEICAAGYSACGSSPQIVKIPINNNEYILLENRQRTYNANGMVQVKMNGGQTVDIHVDSLQAHFLDSATQKHTGVIESINMPDAAIPASGIAAWRVNDWYVKELLKFGAVNAWGGDTFKDHQFGISLIEASGVLGLGKEFSNAAGESTFYFGSGSDLIPHIKKRASDKKTDTVFSINPVGYANTASTFGGYSGLKITAKIAQNAQTEKGMNMLIGDSVTTWRALKIPVEIEWIGKYAIPLPEEEWPYNPTDDDFAKSKLPDFSRIPLGADSIFLGNNRLHAIDSNGVPLPNFPALLSNGEPFSNFHSKPVPLDIKGNDSLVILVPANNGLILAVDSKGKLLKDEFPLAAGTFEYDNPDTLLLYLHDSKYLFAKHRGNISAFELPHAKPYMPSQKTQEQRDEITEFFIFPNPIRSAGRAAARFRTLAPASEATLDIFDITGAKVFSKKFSNVNHGSNQIDGLDFSKLGSDVYSARLNVKFDKSGKNVQKWARIARIRE
jgi:hypothetical protein